MFNEVGYFVIAILVALWLLTLSAGYDVAKRFIRKRDGELAIRIVLLIFLLLLSLWSIQSIFSTGNSQDNIFRSTIYCSIK